MEMVRVGGHFTQVTVANNFTGHGFWQVSPEAIFRAFSPANGYQVEAVLLHEVVPHGAWYLVTDPDRIRQRVELINSNPTYILTIAKRIARTAIFEVPPQQSDYVTLWDSYHEPAASTSGDTRPTTWKALIPQPMKRVARAGIERVARALDRGATRRFPTPSYRRISEAQLMRGDVRGESTAVRTT